MKTAKQQVCTYAYTAERDNSYSSADLHIIFTVSAAEDNKTKKKIQKHCGKLLFNLFQPYQGAWVHSFIIAIKSCLLCAAVIHASSTEISKSFPSCNTITTTLGCLDIPSEMCILLLFQVTQMIHPARCDSQRKTYEKFVTKANQTAAI